MRVTAGDIDGRLVNANSYPRNSWRNGLVQVPVGEGGVADPGDGGGGPAAPSRTTNEDLQWCLSFARRVIACAGQSSSSRPTGERLCLPTFHKSWNIRAAIACIPRACRMRSLRPFSRSALSQPFDVAQRSHPTQECMRSGSLDQCLIRTWTAAPGAKVLPLSRHQHWKRGPAAHASASRVCCEAG